VKFYFNIQYKRLKRWFEKIGLNPILAIFLFILFFLFASKFLFYKSDFAKWIYLIFAVSMLFKLGERSRNKQLKIIFSKDLYLKVRLIENAFIMLPFLIFLAHEQEYLLALGLLVISLFLALVNIKLSLNRQILTPFKRFPFEFIVGFRKTFFFIFLIYFICFKSIQVGNYNLGVFALGLLFLTAMSYYLNPEDKYFVWIFAEKSPVFLKRKMLTSFICASMLSTPVLISLLITFPENLLTTLAVYLLAYVFLSSIIVAKYSAYPHEINLPQGILYALSLWFPPMLLIVIPIFYKQSKRNLRMILE